MATKSMITSTSSFLWFDFVINRDSLLEHLKEESPDPDPPTLLVQFIENAEKYTAAIAQRLANPLPPPATQSAEAARKVEDAARLAKVRAFKSMALQLAAWMNWDLGAISGLPFGVQHALMRYTSDYMDKSPFLFAIYHRWVLRSCQTPLKKPYQQDPLIESLTRTLTPDLSLQELFPLLPDVSKAPPPAAEPPILVPTHLTFARNEPDFSLGAELPLQTFHSMLHLEIGIYLLYQGNAPAAAEHFKQSQLPEDFTYLRMPEEKLEGYHQAAGMIPTDPESPEDTSELKSVEFARLLRTGAMGKIKRLVGLPGFDTHAPVEALNPEERDLYGSHSLDNDSRALHELEQRLLEAQDPTLIKELILKLHSLNLETPGGSGGPPKLRSFYKLFLHIAVPIPVGSTLEKFPQGALQDFIYILAAKSVQFLGIKQYSAARAALETARLELNDQIMALPPHERAAHAQAKTPYYYNINKLLKILEWELVLVDLCELLENWVEIVVLGNGKAKARVNDLCQRCKEIAHTSFHLNKTNDVIPRREVLETIVMSLLNMGEFAFILEQGLSAWPLLEFLTLLAKCCQDLVDRKESGSNYRELWYAVLPIFSNSGGAGGGKGKGAASAVPAAAALIPHRDALMWVVDRAHSQLLVSLFVSILARFHNHIQDDAALQIQSADFLHIWPNILDDVTTSSDGIGIGKSSRAAGSSKLNEKQIFDVLIALLNRLQGSSSIGGVVGLESTAGASYLKCIGDVYLAASEPAQAMKAYLEYLAMATDFFEKHSSPTWTDTALFRRMIKCCEQLGAFTQAMILCQFLPEVDYPLAFGMAQEKQTSDASDTLYGFIWDMAILEFVCNLHHKRGEVGKRGQVLKVMGLLELNGNNNEEIQREAMHLRKSQYMRTLAKLYIFV